MKVSPKDMPKVLMLVILIGGCLIYIGSTLFSHKTETAKAAPAPNLVAGKPVQTAALEPQASPQQYVEQLEEWSKQPAAPAGEPFREVLPRDIAMSIAAQRNHIPGSMPHSQITGTGFGPGVNGRFDPTNPGLPDVRIDFPTITVKGVLVDNLNGAPTNFATLMVDNAVIYAKAGQPIGNDLVVEKVSQQGVQIRAAKEHAFIEISKSYKPNGMAPPAPPKAAGHRRSRR